jgi:hypothetical protein
MKDERRFSASLLSPRKEASPDRWRPSSADLTVAPAEEFLNHLSTLRPQQPQPVADAPSDEPPAPIYDFPSSRRDETPLQDPEDERAAILARRVVNGVASNFRSKEQRDHLKALAEARRAADVLRAELHARKIVAADARIRKEAADRLVEEGEGRLAKLREGLWQRGADIDAEGVPLPPDGATDEAKRMRAAAMAMEDALARMRTTAREEGGVLERADAMARAADGEVARAEARVRALEDAESDIVRGGCLF